MKPNSNRHLQQNLPLKEFSKLGVKEFGGSLLKGNPREARPVSTKRSMHLVMRSSHAKGTQSFLRPDRARKIERLLHRVGTQAGVKIYHYANSGDHLHLIILPRSREAFNCFVRAVSGMIARVTLGKERGAGIQRTHACETHVSAAEKFWDARPFTRIIEWGREFKTVARYVLQNTLEALGFIEYQPRKLRVRKMRAMRSNSPGTNKRPANRSMAVSVGDRSELSLVYIFDHSSFIL